MTSKTSNARRPPAGQADEIEDLYLKLLRWFYEEENLQRAKPIAEQLAAALALRPEVASSIRGQEIQSLLAELRGDLTEAIRRRESEIRKILELYTFAKDEATRDYVFRQYDYGDLSDRLDLLANLYAEQGSLDEAIATLRESQEFCRAHKVPFDGEDLLDTFEKARRAPEANGPEKSVAASAIDDAVRAAYRPLHTSVDNILVDDELSRRFVQEVRRGLPEGVFASQKAIKKRLLNLRRRGGLRA